MDRPMGAKLGRVVSGLLSWVPGVSESSTRKQIASGPMDEFEQHIEEDQVRIHEETTTAGNQSQANDPRILTGVEMSRIEANKQIALARREEKRKSRTEDNKQIALARREEKRKLVETNEVENIAKRKKEHSAAAEKALEKSDHQKRTRDEHSKIQVVRSGDRKRKRKRVEPNKRVSLGEGKKKREREEPNINIPNAEGKRKKTDGKDGCNQLGSSTHKGIS